MSKEETAAMLKELKRVKNYEFAEMLPYVMEFLPLCMDLSLFVM